MNGFRDLARKKQKISEAECVSLLENEKRGVLSVNGDNGYPYGMPMNHYYEKEDGCIYFHCGRAGHRLDALKKDPKVSFCVTEDGTAEENGWGRIVRSVIVFGKAEMIDDIETVTQITSRLSRKFTNDGEYIKKEIEQFAKATLLIKLIPEQICGKTVKES